MFQISDKVVCINDNFSYKPWRAKFYNKLPVKGGIYCIREVCYTPVKNLCYIKLVGIYADEQTYQGGFVVEPGFDPKRFGKIEYSKNSNLNQLTADI